MTWSKACADRQREKRREQARLRTERQQSERPRSVMLQPVAPNDRKGVLNTHCHVCGDSMSSCRKRTKLCSSCHQDISICMEPEHQRNVFCQVATLARQVGQKGLVRCPADGLLSMLDEADVPYEICATRITSVGTRGVQVEEEAWVPPETIAIVQANRPLADRMKALKKFGVYLAKRSSQMGD